MPRGFFEGLESDGEIELELMSYREIREDRSDTPWVRTALLWTGAIATALLLLFVIFIGEPSLKRLDAGNARTISVEGRR